MASSSTGEQELAGGVRLLWAGKDTPRRRPGGWIFPAGDDGTVVRQFDAHVQIEFRGPGAIGLVAGPPHTLDDGDETWSFDSIEVGWTDKVCADDYGPDFVRFRDGSCAMVRSNGILVEAVFHGFGLLVIRRTLASDGLVKTVADIGAANPVTKVSNYPTFTLPGRRGVLVPA